MSLPELLASLRRRPSMYLCPATYETAVAFVCGYDGALAGGLLAGFHEWLVVKLDGYNNLAWPGLVEHLMRAAIPVKKRKRANDHKMEIEFLFAALDQFLAERNEREGLRRIYLVYDDWLRRQEYYNPSSPDWIPRSRA